MPQEIWTIGHSTRSIEAFISLLHAHGITLLVDVRLMPYSRRHPQFNKEALGLSLERAGVRYAAMGGLGGRRTARPDSINLGWRSEGFRGYADYMQTEPFRQALEDLMHLAKATPAAIMCAEAVPWRCHRSLISDALVAKGWTVRHILAPQRADQHSLTPFARVEGGAVTYPAPAPGDPAPRLF